MYTSFPRSTNHDVPNRQAAAPRVFIRVRDRCNASCRSKSRLGKEERVRARKELDRKSNFTKEKSIRSEPAILELASLGLIMNLDWVWLQPRHPSWIPRPPSWPKTSSRYHRVCLALAVTYTTWNAHAPALTFFSVLRFRRRKRSGS